MAGEKASPRQKMIGMMYLVLTALLALNVSKDILKSFVTMNEGLSLSLDNFKDKSDFIYAELDKEKSFDKVRTEKFWKKAQKIKKVCLDIDSYIIELKKLLIKETEGISKEVADTLQLINVSSLDNYDTPTYIMIGDSEDGSKGKARELKNKLAKLKEEVGNILGENTFKALNIKLHTNEVKTSEGIQSWEMHSFYHAPLAASIAMLTKIQNDVKNVELEAITHLFQSINSDVIAFDTVAAKVIAPSSYVMLGEPYKADVFLAAYSKTQNPDILLGTWDTIEQKITTVEDSLQIENGIGKLEVPTSREGIFNYEGTIKMKTKTGYKNYPFSSEYIVAKPSLVVSPIKMNMLYKGVDNPIKISVPGIPSSKIQATITGNGNSLKRSPDGSYLAIIGPSSPRKVKVRVTAQLDTGPKDMGFMEFRVGSVPTPKANFAGKTGIVRCNSKKAANERGLPVKFEEGFAYDLPAKVTSFKITVSRGGSVLTSKKIVGNKFSSISGILKKLKQGDRLDIENIQGLINNRIKRKLDPISVKITP